MASLCCILKRLTRQAKLAGTVGARPVWSAMSQNLTSLQRACAQTYPRTRVAAVNFALRATVGWGGFITWRQDFYKPPSRLSPSLPLTETNNRTGGGWRGGSGGTGGHLTRAGKDIVLARIPNG